MTLALPLAPRLAQLGRRLFGERAAPPIPETADLVVRLVDPAFPLQSVTLEVPCSAEAVRRAAERAVFLPAAERALRQQHGARPTRRAPDLTLNLAQL